MEVGKSGVITEWPQKAGSEAKAQELQYVSRRVLPTGYGTEHA